tara:strand:- start:2043 stop:2657 length:615 start_codon:yes stop_codon:yes gene_type:complete
MDNIMNPIFIEKFLPNGILNLSYSYSVLKFSNHSFEGPIDLQTNSLVGVYGDALMETLLDLSTPVIESNVGKKLFPTYSYFRIYEKGDDLKIHVDRESCEYTVALCLGCDPIEEPYELFIGEKDDQSDYKYYNKKGEYNKYRIDNKFSMLPNNAVIFKGMDKVHWREPSKHDHFITVFLHYVDQEGPYKDYQYDQRSCLGAKKR